MLLKQADGPPWPLQSPPKASSPRRLSRLPSQADAVKLFAAPKIEKKMAFGSVLEPWDKIIPNVKYAPSICESDLARDVGATHRRRGAAQREAEAVALRAAVRPRFDIKTLDGSESSYEFIAKGRVPTLLVRVGTLQIAPKVAAAAAVAAAGVVSGPAAAKVHVRINAMRILPQPTRTRAVDVTTAVLTSKREPPDFRFEEVTQHPLLFDSSTPPRHLHLLHLLHRHRHQEILARHAAPAYERVMQLLQTGPDEELSLALQLCEDASGKVLGVSRVPISSLMRDTNSGRTEAVEATLREPGAGGAEVGRVSIAVTTDWNLACTSSDYLQHGRQRTRVATTASAAVARTMQQEAEDDAMGKRTKPPSSRLELAWQSVMSTAGIPAVARGGARFGAAHLLQVMQLMGSAATAADLDELLGTVTQPKLPKPATPAVSEFGGEAAPSPEPADAEAAEVAAAAAAAAKPPPTATLAQFRRAIASFESRHAAAARECLEMGEIAEAHSHSQAALRISATLLAASEPPIEANSSKSVRLHPRVHMHMHMHVHMHMHTRAHMNMNVCICVQATLTAAGRFAKDSFTMFRYERPAPGTAPDNLASSGSLKLDKPRYDAYLSKKALQAPARGSKFLMTI